MIGGYGEFMYQTGMIDEHQKQYVVQQTDYGVELIQQQKWVEAFQVRAVGWLLHSSKYKLTLFYHLLSRITIISNHSRNAGPTALAIFKEFCYD